MKGGANVSLTVNDLKGVIIPIPDIQYQNKIVKQLKVFDEYINLIEREIEVRIKHTEYYRNKLLTFKELGA